jgi:hypothetical protein
MRRPPEISGKVSTCGSAAIAGGSGGLGSDIRSGARSANRSIERGVGLGRSVDQGKGRFDRAAEYSLGGRGSLLGIGAAMSARRRGISRGASPRTLEYILLPSRLARWNSSHRMPRLSRERDRSVWCPAPMRSASSRHRWSVPAGNAPGSGERTSPCRRARVVLDLRDEQEAGVRCQCRWATRAHSPAWREVQNENVCEARAGAAA